MTRKEKLLELHPEFKNKSESQLEDFYRSYCPNEWGVDPVGSCSMPAPNCYACWNSEVIDYPGALDKPVIKDSGTRREFETGAVRDIQEGKGRCDLMPLYVIGRFLRVAYDRDNNSYINVVFDEINNFLVDGGVDHLYEALLYAKIFDNVFTMFLEVAKHFEEGAKKYGEDNWQKGIPTHCYIDSAVRHYLKFLRGDKDEPHDRAFVWNILCCIWTCEYKPELNDYAKSESVQSV